MYWIHFIYPEIFSSQFVKFLAQFTSSCSWRFPSIFINKKTDITLPDRLFPISTGCLVKAIRLFFAIFYAITLFTHNFYVESFISQRWAVTSKRGYLSDQTWYGKASAERYLLLSQISICTMLLYYDERIEAISLRGKLDNLIQELKYISI